MLFKRESHTSPRKTAAREGSISPGRVRIHDVKRQVRRTKNRGAETRGAAGETRRRALPRPVGPSRPDSPSRRRGAESQAGALVTGTAVAVPWPPPRGGAPAVRSVAWVCPLGIRVLSSGPSDPGRALRIAWARAEATATSSHNLQSGPTALRQAAGGAPRIVSPKTQGGCAVTSAAFCKTVLGAGPPLFPASMRPSRAKHRPRQEPPRGHQDVPGTTPKWEEE